MTYQYLIGYFFLLLAAELIYFRIADKYNIIDKPNHRSSHTNITIRGGGIIIPIALVIAWTLNHFSYPYFIVGLVIISFISFLDDIGPLKRRIRMICHLTAVMLLFYQLAIYNLPIYLILFGFICTVGTINAVNFMDGINGITGGYGLVTILTLFCINNKIAPFTQNQYIIVAAISLVVFNIFNFRTKAKCFAGDVGSVSLAFILTFFIMQLIVATNNLSYIFLLLIYGLDTASTILFRIIRKENIAEAHRSHFYQFLANEKKIPHWAISIIYLTVQCLINYIVLRYYNNSILGDILIIFASFLMFVSMRFVIQGKSRLIGNNKLM